MNFPPLKVARQEPKINSLFLPICLHPTSRYVKSKIRIKMNKHRQLSLYDFLLFSLLCEYKYYIKGWWYNARNKLKRLRDPGFCCLLFILPRKFHPFANPQHHGGIEKLIFSRHFWSLGFSALPPPPAKIPPFYNNAHPMHRSTARGCSIQRRFKNMQ